MTRPLLVALLLLTPALGQDAPPKASPGHAEGDAAGEPNDTEPNGDTPGVIPGGGTAMAYRQRWGKEALEREGGSPGTETAVTMALRWLKRHQAPDGHWDSDQWTERCTPSGGGPGHNEGDARYDVGVTALALLAFLGNGHTHRVGVFKRVVWKGLYWLKQQQRDDGSIGFDPSHGESIYNHALATHALCEAQAIHPDLRIGPAADKAAEFVVKAQNPGLGWKYGVRSGRNDTSITTMMVLALDAARAGGLDPPETCFKGAQRWYARATAHSGEVGYETPGGGSAFLVQNDGRFEALPAMTAAAVFARRRLGDSADEAILGKGVALLQASRPAWEPRKRHYYYWYYGTNAMFQQGGEAWASWNEALQEALLPNQRRDACPDGSWDPTGEWCLAGGRVYATAINALSLETYYRYERSR